MEIDTIVNSAASTPTCETLSEMAWVPFAGSKRKADVADIGNDFDPDCGPAPSKQSAVDEEVADTILRNGFYYDPEIPEFQEPDSSDKMEDDIGPNLTRSRDPGDKNDSYGIGVGGMQLQDLDGKGCCDLVSHSMHASQPNSQSNSKQSTPLKEVSLALSNEIQMTLSQREQSENFMLSKLMMDRSVNANPKALMIWKPHLATLDLSQTPPVAGKQTTRATLRRIMEMTCKKVNPKASNSPKRTCSNTLSNSKHDDDKDCMEIDV